ncbi:MAG: metal-dependent hydrolase [Planctomycetaceae bacterium]|nr:metal-dependent hydrolase [Planctomycetaceae bacterium]
MLGGIGYSFGLPLPTCLLSGGLCSIAGMFPDIDSDTSRSFQECIYLVAGIAAVLFVQRLRQLSIEPDMVLLGGGGMFLFVRFGIGELVKRTTTHRGIFHSIPAAVFSGQITFFLSTGTPEERIFKAFALSSGYLSHLILDEMCSVDSNGRVKKSFGTALKWGDSKKMAATLVLYFLVVCLGTAAFNNPDIGKMVKQFASEKLDKEMNEVNNIIVTNNVGIKETNNELQTLVRQEKTVYPNSNHQNSNAAVKSNTEPVLPRISVSNENHERYLFSRKQRRADRAPSIAVGSETAIITPVSPILPSVSSKVSSSPEVFGADFQNHGNYRSFSLPNHEPAPVFLP